MVKIIIRWNKMFVIMSWISIQVYAEDIDRRKVSIRNTHFRPNNRYLLTYLWTSFLALTQFRNETFFQKKRPAGLVIRV